MQFNSIMPVLPLVLNNCILCFLDTFLILHFHTKNKSTPDDFLWLIRTSLCACKVKREKSSYFLTAIFIFGTIEKLECAIVVKLNYKCNIILFCITKPCM